MRARAPMRQLVTVRPLAERTPDVLGDTPVVMPDNRSTSFTMKMKVSWTVGQRGEPAKPGKEERLQAEVLVFRRDIPAGTTWSPGINDAIELPDSTTLFVADVQGAFPRKRSIRTPSGGWDGWRITLTDRQSTLSAATRYE